MNHAEAVRDGLCLWGWTPRDEMVSAWASELGAHAPESVYTALSDLARSWAGPRRPSLQDLLGALRGPALVRPDPLDASGCDWRCRSGIVAGWEIDRKAGHRTGYQIQVPCSCPLGDPRTTERRFRLVNVSKNEWPDYQLRDPSKVLRVQDLLERGSLEMEWPTKLGREAVAWLHRETSEGGKYASKPAAALGRLKEHWGGTL